MVFPDLRDPTRVSFFCTAGGFRLFEPPESPELRIKLFNTWNGTYVKLCLAQSINLLKANNFL